jgi:hypothetical protein
LYNNLQGKTKSIATNAYTTYTLYRCPGSRGTWEGSEIAAEAQKGRRLERAWVPGSRKKERRKKKKKTRGK